METEIRKAIVTDARGIAETHVASWQMGYKGLIPDKILDNLNVDERADRWEKNLDSGREVFVACNEGRIIGFASTRSAEGENTTKKTADISGFYIHPDFFRRGFGAKLLQHTETKLTKAGFTKAIIWVLSSNEAAIDFYESQGFKCDKLTKLHLIKPDFETETVRYSKALSVKKRTRPNN